MPRDTGARPARRPLELREGLFLAAVGVAFIAWLWQYLRLDFWYDEAFTLTNYVFVPLGTTLTDYSFPNNHVLANLLSNLFLGALGIDTIHRLADSTWLIRLLPLACSLVTLGYVYAVGRRWFDRFTGLAAVTVLATTVPFLNFAVQVRGFSLSMMLLTMLLYHSSAFARRPAWRHAVAVTALAALALYAIPLNLYFILSLAGVVVAGYLAAVRRATRLPRPLPLLLLLLLAGTGIAALLYSPMLGDVVTNRFVRSHGLFNTATVFESLPRVLGYFMAPRHAFWAVVAAAPVAWVLARRRGSALPGPPLLAGIALLLGPFLLSFVRGDQPWLRVFVNLAPVFALLVAAALRCFGDALPRLRRHAPLVLAVLLAYCVAMTWVARRNISGRLLRDIETGARSQDIYYNYYQAYYRPDDLLARFGHDRDPAVPVVLFDVDWAALPVYLDRHSVPVLGPDALDAALRRHGRAYVAAAQAPRFVAFVRQHYPGLAARKLYPEPDFHSVFELVPGPPETRPGR